MMNERTRGEERMTRRSRETENKETERRMKRDREREAISRRCEARIGPSRGEAVFLINSLAVFSSSENFDWV